MNLRSLLPFAPPALPPLRRSVSDGCVPLGALGAGAALAAPELSELASSFVHRFAPSDGRDLVERAVPTPAFAASGWGACEGARVR